MIGVGERSGRLDESLTYLADYFEKEVYNTTKNLTTVLEPLLLIFVGLVVGFIAVSVITPIYEITSKFSGSPR
jgi:type IV pilus assembly protein PilC